MQTSIIIKNILILQFLKLYKSFLHWKFFIIDYNSTYA